MWFAALIALLPQQGLPQDPEARFQRRISPEVEVVQTCRPAVVSIRTAGTVRQVNPWLGIMQQRPVEGMGSGVVVKKQGFVITNYHVVKQAEQVIVNFAEDVDSEDYVAQIISFVAEEDLALLKIEPRHAGQEFPTIQMGTSADLMLGERVIAIGNPYGQAHTVSQGIISGLHRDVPIPSEGLHLDEMIQTDAAINSGNSGGPLLNINGELIGINSCINAQAQNIGFAIPVDRVKSVLQYRLTSPDAAATWLGFEVDNLRIASVVPGGPAELAGLRPGDCVVALGGQPVRSNEEYRLARIALRKNQLVPLRYEREGKVQTVQLEPWDANDGVIYQRLGLVCEEVPTRLGKAVRVLEVAPASPAAQLQLQAGDVFSAAKVPAGARWRAFQLRSKGDLAEIVTQFTKPGSQLELELYRDLNKDNVLRRDELHRGTLTVR